MEHPASQAAARGDTIVVDAEFFHALLTREARILYVPQRLNIASCGMLELMSGKTPPYDPFDSSMVRIAAKEYDILVKTHFHRVLYGPTV
ncbi:hypothetical protein UCDDS831_g00858 [Diplodia seriata]|uniref:Uncharacterized protein n=1 Tax=Diplodia seriata TaxID=420778 RepID=A0A0G2GVL1_9PEZI|nr:hypothetical protein UCDDS831_g00858 [Diplodia seriata]